MSLQKTLFGLAVALTLALPAYAQTPATGSMATGSMATRSMATRSMAKSSTPMKAAAPKPALLDINTASEADLKALKGVGDTRAKAIIKGRPYNGKDDLVQKKILPQKVYDGIKDKIIAKQK